LSHKYRFDVEVKDNEDDYSEYFIVEINHYQIWLRDGTMDGTRGNETLEFDLFISDLEGNPVENAYISFDYEVGYKVEEGRRNGTTDEDGKCTFTIPYVYGEEVDLEGSIQGDHIQDFDAEFTPYWAQERNEEDDDGEYDPPSGGIAVNLVNRQDLYEPNTETTFEFTAYHDGEIADGDIFHVYAYSVTQLLFYDNITVSNGTISLTLTTPELSDERLFTELEFTFISYVERGIDWTEESIFISADGLWYRGGLDFSVEELKTGEKTEIEVDASGIENHLGVVYIFPYYGDETEVPFDYFYEYFPSEENTWHMITPYPPIFALSEDGSSYLADIQLPHCFADHEKYLISLFFIDERPSGESIILDSIILEEGESYGSQESEGSDDITLDSGRIFAIGMLIILYLLS